MTPPQTASQVLTLGDADFDDALAASDRPVLVDVDANPELVERFEIASVPTLLLMRGDVVLDRFTASTAAEVATRIEWLT